MILSTVILLTTMCEVYCGCKVCVCYVCELILWCDGHQMQLNRTYLVIAYKYVYILNDCIFVEIMMSCVRIWKEYIDFIKS